MGLSWQKLDPGKGKQGRLILRKVCAAHKSGAGLRPHLPKSRSWWPRRALGPCGPVGTPCGPELKLAGVGLEENQKRALGRGEVTGQQRVHVRSPASPVTAAWGFPAEGVDFVEGPE